MQDSQLNTVNPFYLQRVVKLAEHSRIVTSDDVYAANGMKLLAKGTPISHEVQDRLIKHKLKKPLESSLSVADAIDPQYLVALAQDVLASQTKLQPILFFGNHGGQALEILQGLALNGPMRMVLTMLERSGNEELRQSVECALVALVLGIELGLAQERLQHLAIGSLLHDIGEMYINPEYLRGNNNLKPSEWRHVASHPLVSKMLMDEVGQFPPLVGQIVLEHHERLDGSGYPQRAAGDQLSLEGLIVGVADTVCAVFRCYGRPLARAEIAMRIVPGQFPPQVTQIVTLALRGATQPEPVATELPAVALMTEGMHRLLKQLAQVLIALDELQDEAQIKSYKPAQLVVQHAVQRVNLIQRAFSSTGLDSLPRAEALGALAANDSELQFEIIVVLEEIAWRLRELSRDLQLRVESMPEFVAPLFERLVLSLHMVRS
jgi:HD-GYP domain-containing protein (c-di-GMP phosphodiesterase class II)